MQSLIERAESVASAVLAPHAASVDAEGVIPAANFAALSRAQLYGAALGDEVFQLAEAAEHLISGCLATGFVWAQHHGVARALAATANNSLRDALLPHVRTGKIKLGVSYAGLTTHGQTLRATDQTGTTVLSGTSPFVTGWNLVDAIGVWANAPDHDEARLYLLREPERLAGVSANPMRLIAANASSTVSLRFDDVLVDEGDLIARRPHRKPPSNSDGTDRLYAALALGVGRAVLRHLDSQVPERPDIEQLAKVGAHDLDTTRKGLDAAFGNPEAMRQARTEAIELAIKLATAAATRCGSTTARAGDPAERLVREALFCAVCATGPEIRDLLAARLIRP